MTLTGKEAPDLSAEQAALSGLLAAVTWEHPCKKAPDRIQLAPRTVVYPVEVLGIIDFVKSGRQHTVP
jgi:hypothetical protein